MKKIITILMLIMCFSSLFAVENFSQKKNELTFKLGGVPYFETLFSGLLALNYRENAPNSLQLPVLSIEYLKYIAKSHGFGGTLTIGSPVVCYGKDVNFIPVIALQGTYRGIYLNREKFKLYGEISLGGELIIDKASHTCLPMFAAHAVPLGFWFGSEKFFGTAELGMGTQGTALTLGCGFRF